MPAVREAIEAFTDRCARTDHRDWFDSTEPVPMQEPIENSEATEPMLPTDATEPTLPTDSSEPWEQIESVESVDHSDQVMRLILPQPRPATGQVRRAVTTHIAEPNSTPSGVACARMVAARSARPRSRVASSASRSSPPSRPRIRS